MPKTWTHTNRNPIRQPTQLQARFTMPIGGLNFSASTLDMPVTDAYLLDNFIPKSSGIEVRKGYRFWINEADKFGAPVKTVMTYNDENPLYDTLFCSPSNTGAIFDITQPDVPPVLSLTPSSNPIRPGLWYSTQFSNETENFLLVVCEGAGYYKYTVDPLGVPDWTEIVTGVAPGEVDFPPGDTHTTKDFAFIFTWKSRVWFLIENSAVAYYLPIGAQSGLLTAFDFGQLLRRGGPMSYGSAWTYDSGSGIDDSLVMVSSQGEVLVYQGTDPDIAGDFTLKGVWNVGRIPFGRRAFVDHGGDLLIFCEYGVVGMSNIVAGKLHTASIMGGVGAKVNQRLAPLCTQYLEHEFWFMELYSPEELLILGSPIITTDTSVNQHFVMNSITNSWCTISYVDMLDATTWKGNLIAGSRSGNVYDVFKGYLDGSDYTGTVPGEAVTAKFQNAFNDFQSPNANKRMLRIKLYGLLNGNPLTYFAKYQPEYVLTSPIDAEDPGTSSAVSLWDLALWDASVWATGQSSFHKWFGVNGFGKKMSLQVAVRATGQVLATDYEALYETGIGL